MLTHDLHNTPILYYDTMTRNFRSETLRRTIILFVNNIGVQ